MDTHDEDTRKFFKGSKVRCKLVPRSGDDDLSFVRKKVVGTFFTHHQKFVIADAPPPQGASLRPLVGYLGGIDLCNGRYDTQDHSLFRTLTTVHKDDFHQSNFTTSLEAGGPREPWHDIHCRLEGPPVWDMVTNFEQRWRKAVKYSRARLHVHDLRTLHQAEGILRPGSESEMGAPGEGPFPSQLEGTLKVPGVLDADVWSVQFFRSIDSGSVKGFQKHRSNRVFSEKLVLEKGVAVEKSIQEAYIRAIRRAQHFIYIENQYFLGSSYAWSENKDAGADQLIPLELAMKVASKIRDGQNFRCYVVLPMWPEGVPTSGSVQAILHWQTLTMQMMYGVIAQAIRDKGIEGVTPRDFLTFFCLGNRETKGADEPDPAKPPAADSIEGKILAARRQMLYVHAKMMVVDDDYVIVGSANINQRSMDGSRDTETAMGGYQPAHTWSMGVPPKGQVYGFRMSLWAEHLGTILPTSAAPSSLECIRQVNLNAEARWDQYMAEEVTDLNGHLLAYPVVVGEDGSVMPKEGQEEFPDTGGLIIGKIQRLPTDLTT